MESQPCTCLRDQATRRVSLMLRDLSGKAATGLIEIAINVVHFDFSMSCAIAVVSCDQDSFFSPKAARPALVMW